MNNLLPVWIVEDDVDDQFFIKLAFQSIEPPIAVKLLADGDELVPSLNEATSLPKLVLLDLNMQRKNGYETLLEVRSNPQYQNLPVVILTTSSDSTDVIKSIQLGADGFMSKCSSHADLLGLARTLAANWSLSD